MKSEPPPLSTALLTLLLLAGCAHKRPDAVSAHSTLWSAREIRTQDPKSPLVQALVVRDGKIVFTGTRDAAVEFAGSDAAVEDFADATIVPGLVDSHAHLLSLGRSLSIARLNAARSQEEAVDILQKATGSSQGEWLLGRGWDQNDWTSKEFPTRAVLDAKFPIVPVYLSRIDGHAAWVNSEALKSLPAPTSSALPD